MCYGKEKCNGRREKGLRNLNNLILVGVLMAVGIVLRLLAGVINVGGFLSLIHISEPTRPY